MVNKYKKFFLKEADYQSGDTWVTDSGLHAGKYGESIHYFHHEDDAKAYASKGSIPR
jgi:hypothetical protein